MSFLSPLWLAALAALTLPLLIHLLSRGERRRIRVGSTRLLREAARHQARRLRPTRLLLLAVRCLLLAALALALAEPRLAREPAPRPDVTWVVVDPEVTALDDPQLAGTLAAALDEAETKSWLVDGLPEIDADQAPPAEQKADLWSLLREIDTSMPPGAMLEIFAVDRLDRLRGERPTLRRPLRWHLAPVETGDLASGEPPRKESPPIRAALLAAPERAADAALVRAALDAASHSLGRELLDAPLAEAELVVRLDPSPMPEDVLAAVRGGAVLIRDGSDEFVTLPGEVGRVTPREPGAAPFTAHRRAALPPRPDALVEWTDGEGAAWLDVSRVGAGWSYRVHGRFHPRWTDLVDRPAFPIWWRALLARHLPEASPRSVEASAGGQGRPRVEIGKPPLTTRHTTSPEQLAWLVVALAFLAERWLATRVQEKSVTIT